MPESRINMRFQRVRRSLDFNKSSSQAHSLPDCAPQTAADVANVFLSLVIQHSEISLLMAMLTQWQMKRFSLYEEYGAKCEMLHADVDMSQKTALVGHDYDKAIETLSASLNPINTRAVNLRKALGLKDLLIKASTAYEDLSVFLFADHTSL